MSASDDPADIVTRAISPRDYEAWDAIETAKSALMDWLEGYDAPAEGSEAEKIALAVWRARDLQSGIRGEWHVLETERYRVEMRLDFDIAGEGENIRNTCHAVEVRCRRLGQ